MTVHPRVILVLTKPITSISQSVCLSVWPMAGVNLLLITGSYKKKRTHLYEKRSEGEEEDEDDDDGFCD